MQVSNGESVLDSLSLKTEIYQLRLGVSLAEANPCSDELHGQTLHYDSKSVEFFITPPKEGSKI